MAEEIIYKKGYVFFIDILGFKKFIETESAAYIKKIIDYFHDFFLNGDFAKSIKTCQNYIMLQIKRNLLCFQTKLK